MLKKFGLVAISVTAGLVAVAPVASAATGSSGSGTNNTCVAEVGDDGSTQSIDQCNNLGQSVGEGNIVNGMPVELPALPTLPTLPLP